MTTFHHSECLMECLLRSVYGVDYIILVDAFCVCSGSCEIFSFCIAAGQSMIFGVCVATLVQSMETNEALKQIVQLLLVYCRNIAVYQWNKQSPQSQKQCSTSPYRHTRCSHTYTPIKRTAHAHACNCTCRSFSIEHGRGFVWQMLLRDGLAYNDFDIVRRAIP